MKGADYSPTNRSDEAYTYDANGNRTNAGYVTGGNNQLSADAKYDYTYDDEGNLKTRRDRSTNITRTFTWDYRNRLVSVVEGGVSIAAYSYDAGNQRISKTTGGVTTHYVYDRDNAALEFTGSSTAPTVRYFYGTRVDQILAQDKGGGNVSWQLTDQLGSVRALVGNDGVVRNRFEYDAFGNVVSSMVGATDDSRYRYTGREFDAETGLNYYRARYFDSFSGRFIGQDPIGFDSGDGANLYAYVKNRPTDRIDPLGLYGRAITSRMIRYEDRDGTHTVTDIGQVVAARQQDPYLYIQSDITRARITYTGSENNGGSKANRSKVVDIRDSDQAGHIIGKQLGGDGNDANNLFAQATRGFNQYPKSDWRDFEQSVRRNIDAIFLDPTSLKCPPDRIRVSAIMEVNLWYKRTQPGSTETLRPIGVSAGVVYLPIFIAYTNPIKIKNP